MVFYYTDIYYLNNLSGIPTQSVLSVHCFQNAASFFFIMLQSQS